jgi:hypothetical protein
VVGIMTGAIETAGSAVAEAQADAEVGMTAGNRDALG